MITTKETSITRGQPCALREPTVVLVGMSVGTECEAAGRVEAVAVEVVGSEASGCLLDWALGGVVEGGSRVQAKAGWGLHDFYLTFQVMVQGR